MSDESRRLKEDVSIDRVLAYYGGKYPRAGGWGNWRSYRCPFHQDDIESASVNTRAGRFNCHACGVSGDIIALVMQREQVGFAGAIEFIRDRIA